MYTPYIIIHKVVTLASLPGRVKLVYCTYLTMYNILTFVKEELGVHEQKSELLKWYPQYHTNTEYIAIILGFFPH